MSSRQSLLSHVRLSSLMMGTGSVLAGTACAAVHGNAEYLPATLCIIFAFFAQLSGNFYYRYYDITHSYLTDDEATNTRKETEPKFVLKQCSVACALLAAMCGLAIATMAGLWAILVGVCIAIVSWLTMGSSLPLLRTPYGIACPFTLFGVICVITTSLIQTIHDATHPLSWFDITPALYMSIVMGLLCVNSTLVYGYANYTYDKKIGKDTFAATTGRRVTRIVFLGNTVLSSAIMASMCLQLNLPLKGIDMVPAAVCLMLGIYIWWKMRTLPRYQLHELVNPSNFNVLLMGLLSFIIFELTGLPDGSTLTFFGI